MKERGEVPFSTNSATASQPDVNGMSDLSTLTKARLSLLVVFTTAIGYTVGRQADSAQFALLFAVLGTALAAASAAALN
ncbi:MAG: hypothetical protein WCL08_01345, partial [Verrucomicrobiota bacterium]